MTDPQTRAGDAVLVTLVKPSRGVGTISAYLQRAIETGAYSEGDRLPPERQLAVTFHAARSTVRRALDQLEKAGLVSRRLGSGTFVGATAAANRRNADLADQISPLQLIEARLAVEPFTTRLAVLHATRRNLDDMEVVLARAEESRSTTRTLLQMGRRVPSPDRAGLRQSAADQRLPADQPRAAARPMGRDEGEDPDAGRDRRLQPPASRHLQRAARARCASARRR